MKLLLDAHISRAILGFLESQGHDCVHAEARSPGLTDSELLRIATDEQRILVTADKDFGELVFRHAVPVAGAVPIRFRAASEAARCELFAKHWPTVETSVGGYFVVVMNHMVRRSPLPLSNLT